MKHANGECVIEGAPQWKIVKVCLNHVRVLEFARGGESRFDASAKINSYDVACAPSSGQLRVSPFAAAAFEHDLVAEEFRRDGCYPAKELFRILRVSLRKVRPLPAEILRGRGLLFFNL